MKINHCSYIMKKSTIKGLSNHILDPGSPKDHPKEIAVRFAKILLKFLKEGGLVRFYDSLKMN